MEEWVWVWWWLLACMAGWGGSSFLMGYAGRNLPYVHSFFYNTVGMTVGLALVLTLMGGGGDHTKKNSRSSSGHGRHGGGREQQAPDESGGLNLEGLLGWREGTVAIFSGIASAVADIAFYQMARLGVSVSVAGPVSGLYLTLPAVLGVIVLGEPLTWSKVAGLLLAILAIYLLSGDDGDNEGQDDDDNQAPKDGAQKQSSVAAETATIEKMEEGGKDAEEKSNSALAVTRRRDKPSALADHDA